MTLVAMYDALDMNWACLWSWPSLYKHLTVKTSHESYDTYILSDWQFETNLLLLMPPPQVFEQGVGGNQRLTLRPRHRPVFLYFSCCCEINSQESLAEHSLVSVSSPSHVLLKRRRFLHFLVRVWSPNIKIYDNLQTSRHKLPNRN